MNKKLLNKDTKNKIASSSFGLSLLSSKPKSGATIINPFLLPGSTTLTPIYFGNKNYELSDWLGNVRVVINDRKTPVNTGNVTVCYKPQVTSVTDYYSFGSQIAERTYDPVKPAYRFGFNTQEKVFEITQDHYTAKFWEYDARLGRRWNVDPKNHPSLSYYHAFNLNPVWFSDPLGDTIVILVIKSKALINNIAKIIIDKSIKEKVISLIQFVEQNKLKISINSSFRSTEHQEQIQITGITPAKPGSSRHEAGFAIDFNLYDESENKIEITKENKFIKYAKSLGFRWGGEFKKKDPIHIDIWSPNEKSKFGYNSFKEAYNENQKMYKERKYKTEIIELDKKNN